MEINAVLTSKNKLIRVLDENEISLELDKPISTISFTLSYNPEVFEYVDGSVTSALKTNKVDVSTPGTLLYEGIIDGGQGATKFTFTFKALKESETVTFKVTDLLLDKETSTQEPQLTLNTLPFVIHGASSLPLVDDTHPDGE